MWFSQWYSIQDTLDSPNGRTPCPPLHTLRAVKHVTKQSMNPCDQASSVAGHVTRSENVHQVEAGSHVMWFDPKDWTKVSRRTVHRCGWWCFLCSISGSPVKTNIPLHDQASSAAMPCLGSHTKCLGYLPEIPEIKIWVGNKMRWHKEMGTSCRMYWVASCKFMYCIPLIQSYSQK